MKTAVTLALLVLVVAAPAVVAQSTDHTVVIFAFSYLPGQAGVLGFEQERSIPLTIQPRDTVTANNLDAPDIIETHTITSDLCQGSQACSVSNPVRLFDSDFISVGESAQVVGISNLPPGTYSFHCRIHLFMHGLLIVGQEPVAGSEP